VSTKNANTVAPVT